MAGSFLDFLSAAARASYPFIQRGVREGLSANAIQKSLSANDIHLRRTTILDLVRRERELVSAGSSLKFLNRNARPDPRRLPEALTSLRRQYSFTVEVRGTSLSNGESRVQNVTVVSDRLLTRGEIEDVAEGFATDGGERYGMNVDSLLLTRGMKAGALGTI
jgi:hypothetical protein